MERVKADVLTSFGGWLKNSGNRWKMGATMPTLRPCPR